MLTDAAAAAAVAGGLSFCRAFSTLSLTSYVTIVKPPLLGDVAKASITLTGLLIGMSIHDVVAAL